MYFSENPQYQFSRKILPLAKVAVVTIVGKTVTHIVGLNLNCPLLLSSFNQGWMV